MRAAKVLASVANSKGSCECCEQQRFLRVLRAAKVLASVCEQQRFLLVYAGQEKFLRACANSKGSCACLTLIIEAGRYRRFVSCSPDKSVRWFYTYGK